MAALLEIARVRFQLFREHCPFVDPPLTCDRNGDPERRSVEHPDVAEALHRVEAFPGELLRSRGVARFEQDHVIKAPKAFGFILKPGANTRPR